MPLAVYYNAPNPFFTPGMRSPPGIAIIGDTAKYHDQIIAMGGLAQKYGHYFFPMEYKTQVEEFVRRVNAQIPEPTINPEADKPFKSPKGIAYHKIHYIVPFPAIGQKIILKINENKLPYTVTAIKTEIADDIEITQTDVIPANTSRAIIIGGKYQVPCLEVEHELLFQ